MGSTASSHGETDAWLKEGRYVTTYERGEGPVRAEGVTGGSPADDRLFLWVVL